MESIYIGMKLYYIDGILILIKKGRNKVAI